MVSLWKSISIIVCLALLVAIFFGYLGLNLHVPIMFHIILTAFLGWIWGWSWTEIETMLLKGVGRVSLIVLILLLIGGLIGLWITGGTIPTIIVLGLDLLQPSLFFLIAFYATCVTSFAMGTGIGTISTVGIAFFSIGMAMGLPLPMIAGAIISGSYFGDRFSPLSPILIFTASTAEAPVPSVLKSMLLTTIPALLLSSLFFYYLGMDVMVESMGHVGGELTGYLQAHFPITLWTLLPPLLIVILSLLRIPTTATLAVGLVFSLLLLLPLNPSQTSNLLHSIFSGPPAVESQNLVLSNLFARGGMVSMLELLALIMMAGALSGLLEAMGVFQVLLQTMMKKARSTRSLFLATAASSLFSAMVGCNQLLAVLMPGRAFHPHVKGPEERATLARVLGDTGLVTSPLIPWNINALMVTGVLGVEALAYLPYAIMNWSLPLISILFLVCMGPGRSLVVKREEALQAGTR